MRKFIFAANFKRRDEATEIRYSGAATVGFPYGRALSLSLSQTDGQTDTQAGLACLRVSKNVPTQKHSGFFFVCVSFIVCQKYSPQQYFSLAPQLYTVETHSGAVGGGGVGVQLWTQRTERFFMNQIIG